MHFRYTMNLLAALSVAIGTMFDVGVWYYVKDLKIFDEKVRDTEIEEAEHIIEENPRRRFSVT
jgi:organic anion transporter 5A